MMQIFEALPEFFPCIIELTMAHSFVLFLLSFSCHLPFTENGLLFLYLTNAPGFNCRLKMNMDTMKVLMEKVESDMLHGQHKWLFLKIQACLG